MSSRSQNVGRSCQLFFAENHVMVWFGNVVFIWVSCLKSTRWTWVFYFRPKEHRWFRWKPKWWCLLGFVDFFFLRFNWFAHSQLFSSLEFSRLIAWEDRCVTSKTGAAAKLSTKKGQQTSDTAEEKKIQKNFFN